MNRLTINIITLSSILVVALMFFGLPVWNVWQAGLAGQAQLRQAEFNRRISVEEAQATLDSAELLAQAEAIRARGVAEANEIIGVSLRENEAYLRYLWINGLHDGSSEIIYVPTEANLPILEATRGLRVGASRGQGQSAEGDGE